MNNDENQGYGIPLRVSKEIISERENDPMLLLGIVRRQRMDHVSLMTKEFVK